jgi:3-deoxy-D-manno-octulosonic-acid transferase
MSELGVASRRWSELGGSPADVPVVIVDSVGHLAHLYRGCHMAYVGGGFGAGVHSVLEPAAVGLPVLFGPKHWRSPEARALVARTGATVVRRPEELTNVLQSLCSDVAVRENRGRICRSLVTEGAGASKRVAERVASIAKASG